jgi:hypothetical protein
MPSPARLFVSYSHEDKRWLEELRLALSPWIRENRIDFFADTEIAPDSEWRREIESRLTGANVAVLLVTTKFLDSDFIQNVELPVILEQARIGSLRLLWVPVGHSLVLETPLGQFQAAVDLKRPLDTLPPSQRSKKWVEIAQSIKEAVGVSAVGRTLESIDESYNVIRSIAEGHVTPPENHSVARYSVQADRVDFTAYGTTVTISAEDMRNLDKDSLELIQMYEDSMEQRFERIKKLYPSRVLPDGEIDADVERQLRNLAKPMCEDLHRILDFLAGMGKYLTDHYHRYRLLCEQLQS